MALTQTPEWQALLKHQQRLAHTHLRDLFAQDTQRFEHFSLELQGLLLDYSKQRIDAPCLQSLIALAEQAQLSQWRDRMFAGEKSMSRNIVPFYTLHCVRRKKRTYPMPNTMSCRKFMQCVNKCAA